MSTFNHEKIDYLYDTVYESIEYLLKTDTEDTSLQIPSLIVGLQNVCDFDGIDDNVADTLKDFLKCAYRWALMGDLNASLYALEDFYSGIVNL